MSEASNTDLSMIGRQQTQLLAEAGTLRDDMGVMMAILQRVDGTLSGMVNEIRATHAQHARLASRVRDLENQQGYARGTV